MTDKTRWSGESACGPTASRAQLWRAEQESFIPPVKSGERPHLLAKECWCNPTVEPIAVAIRHHAALDWLTDSATVAEPAS